MFSKKGIFVSFLLILSSITVFSSSVPAASDKRVFCHYTAWHNPFNASEAAARFVNFPEFESSGNIMKDYKKEVRNAIASGIDGFFIDIVFKNRRKANYVANIKALLKAAEGTNFTVGACLDMGHNARKNPKLDVLVDELADIFKHCGQSPNFPKIDGKYILATYTWNVLTPEQWSYVRSELKKRGCEIYLIANFFHAFSKLKTTEMERYKDCFDMIYTFGEYGISGQSIQECFDIYANTAKKLNKGWMATIHPGYVGGWLNGRNDFYQPLRGFDQVYDCYAAMRPGRADWLHITTWNDHDESPMMPMIFEFGSNSEINRAFIDKWKKKDYRSKKPKLFFAYHREEIPGAVWRLEALSLPYAGGGNAEVSGWLCGPDGRKLYTLEPRSMSMDKFDRAEWNIPTAGLAEAPALTPQIRWKVGDKVFDSTLPVFFLKSGWIQNQTTVKVPAHRMLNAEASLKIDQSGSDLNAELKFNSPEKIVHASLWRNDRPMGEFISPAPERRLLYIDINLLKPVNFSIALKNASFVYVGQKHIEKGDKFDWTKDLLKVKKSQGWYPVRAVLAITGNTKLEIKIGKEKVISLTPGEIVERKVVLLGKKRDYLWLRLADYDPQTMNHSRLDLKNATLKLKLLSRDQRPDDVFYARLNTENGKVFFSPVELPFCKANDVRQMNVVETCVNMETSSGASGRPNQSGFLVTPPNSSPSVVKKAVHRANLRAQRWTFERGGWDELGERPFQDVKKYSWLDGMKNIKPLGINGSNALVLDGRKTYKFRARNYPVGACTIEFALYLDELPTGETLLIGRRGWQSAFNFYLEPDGKIKVVRDGIKRKEVSFVSEKAIMVKTWSKICLTFNEKIAKLYIDGKEQASARIPAGRKFGNCTAQIGSFKGRIDDITFLSWPAPPGDKSFPAFKKYRKLEPIYKNYVIKKAIGTQKKDVFITPEKYVKMIKTGSNGDLTMSAGIIGRSCSTALLGVLKDNQELKITLKEVNIKTPGKGWTALLIALKNSKGLGVNFNLSNAEAGFVSLYTPKWKNIGHRFKFSLPAVFKFQKYYGKVLMAVNDKIVYVADEDASAPYESLNLEMTLQKTKDSMTAIFLPPEISNLQL